MSYDAWKLATPPEYDTAEMPTGEYTEADFLAEEIAKAEEARDLDRAATLREKLTTLTAPTTASKAAA